MARQAGIVFLDAFLGSLATLIAGSALLDVNVEGDALPDVRLLGQMLIAAVIAGAVALLTFARAMLAEGE